MSFLPPTRTALGQLQVGCGWRGRALSLSAPGPGLEASVCVWGGGGLRMGLTGALRV